MKNQDFFKNFYGVSLQKPQKPIDMEKSFDQFYMESDPTTRPLMKGRNTNVVAVLDYHMRKASEDKKKKKSDRLVNLGD